MLVAIGCGAVGGAVLDRPGLGWLLVGVVIAAGLGIAGGREVISRERLMWTVLALGLLAVGTVRASPWLFGLCVLAALLAGALAVSGARTAAAIYFALLAVPIGALRGIPWGIGGLRTGPRVVGRRLAGSVLVTVVLLVVFGALFAGADAAFARLVSAVLPTPDASVGPRLLLVAPLVGGLTLGGGFVLLRPPVIGGEQRAGRLRRLEWGLPVGALVVLFALFIAVQLAALFGGDAYVRRTAGLTYAEYARSGFWQLSAVTVLTLAVIAAVARFARRETAADRGWLRGLLGGLSGLAMVLVASALHRMWAYQDAYGFTGFRLVVLSFELWFGLIYLLVIAAGVRLRGRWLPRAVLATGMAGLLALAVLNPDRFIADRDLTHQPSPDLDYLSELSVDALPAFDRLPPDQRARVLARMRADQTGQSADDWRSWNLARSRATEILR